MERANGSSLILPTPPARVPLRRLVAAGQAVEVQFEVEPDPRMIDERETVLVTRLHLNELTIGLAQAQSTIAALSAQLAALLIVVGEGGVCANTPAEGEPSRERVEAARALVESAASTCTLQLPQRSALDEIATD